MQSNDSLAQKEKLKDLIKDVKIAMLFTHSQQDGFNGRPMYTADLDENGTIWFFTNEFSGKVDEITQDHDVALSYTAASNNLYVVVKGRATVSNDRQKIEQLWNPSMKIWFPDGLSDPRIALLKVVPEEAEYWNGSSSKLVVGFKMLKAMVQGEHYQDGEHGKINVN